VNDALLVVVVAVALGFDFTNGFHDTANAVATSVGTRAVSPRVAVLIAAVANLAGAFVTTAVAKNVAKGLIDANLATQQTLLAALLGAIIWNLLTWWFGLPSSSSHALIGGLCGSALAASNGNWNVIIWSQPSKQHFWLGKGLLWKVIVPMLTSPIAGLILGFIIMGLLYFTLRNSRPVIVNRFFGRAQIASASAMGFMH